MVSKTFDTCFTKTAQILIDCDRLLITINRGISESAAQVAASRAAMADSVDTMKALGPRWSYKIL